MESDRVRIVRCVQRSYAVKTLVQTKEVLSDRDCTKENAHGLNRVKRRRPTPCPACKKSLREVWRV